MTIQGFYLLRQVFARNWILLVVSASTVVGGVIAARVYPFQATLAEGILAFAILNYLASCAVVIVALWLFYAKRRSRTAAIDAYSLSSERVVPLLLMAIAIISLFAIATIKGLGSGEISGRSDVFAVLESYPLWLRYLRVIAVTFCVYWAAFAIGFKLEGKILYLSLLGVLLGAFSTLSRSEFARVLFLTVIALGLSRRTKTTKTAFIVGAVAVVLGSLYTLLQGRSIRGIIEALTRVLESRWLYASFSYYLSSTLVEFKSELHDVLYPFFGYMVDKPLTLLFNIPNAVDAEFVSSMRRLGPGLSANVVYPWWAFFWSVFGWPGLAIKAAFAGILVYQSLRTGWLFTSTLLLYSLLFDGRHPLLTSENVLALFTCLGVDFSVHRRRTRHARLRMLPFRRRGNWIRQNSQ